MGMKECETCTNREYQNDLICCSANQLAFIIREGLKQIPFFGEYVSDYECQAYLQEERLED